ncbi:hypothetical protein DERF_004195 [Dermatophagoides farinae]|uniref:Uncharacterized protein n=1 Tax=Dermatophagoides farinae TaxID=6954 RepID=A0A922I4G5_DERFA|nr:hypothetical protein DERF_004195 [Dermatophagoides farinae]
MAQIQVVTCKSLPHAWMQPAYGCHYVNCQDVTKILIHTLVIKADICHTRHNRLTGKNGDGITSQLHETSNYVIAAINCDGIRLPDSAWSIYKNNSPINGSLSTNVTLANGIKSGLLLLQYLQLLDGAHHHHPTDEHNGLNPFSSQPSSLNNATLNGSLFQALDA